MCVATAGRFQPLIVMRCTLWHAGGFQGLVLGYAAAPEHAYGQALGALADTLR
jgi:hypothetical protein